MNGLLEIYNRFTDPVVIEISDSREFANIIGTHDYYRPGLQWIIVSGEAALVINLSHGAMIKKTTALTDWALKYGYKFSPMRNSPR